MLRCDGMKEVPDVLLGLTRTRGRLYYLVGRYGVNPIE